MPRAEDLRSVKSEKLRRVTSNKLRSIDSGELREITVNPESLCESPGDLGCSRRADE